MSFLVWAVVLLLVAAVLVFLEIFLPSMGALGSLAVVLVLAATFMAYKGAAIWGALGILTLAAIVLPLTIALALWLFPRTPLGTVMLDGPPPAHELADEVAGLKLLVGEKGFARSKMLPSGAVQIRHKTFDAISEGAPIEAGQAVVVVGLKMKWLVVRALDSEPLAAAASAPVGDTAHGADLLSQPIDELGIEPIDPLS